MKDKVTPMVLGLVLLALLLGMRQPGGRSEAPQAGEEAPNFSFELNGQPRELHNLRGQVVLVNFWATWCPPCKIEMPWFVDLQKQYGDQGLQVIGVAMDDDAEKESAKIAAFSKEMNLNYPVLLGNDKVGDAYGGVEGLPTTFYIGRDGRIVSAVSGLISHSEIEDNVKKALAAAVAQK